MVCFRFTFDYMRPYSSARSFLQSLGRSLGLGINSYSLFTKMAQNVNFLCDLFNFSTVINTNYNCLFIC